MFEKATRMKLRFETTKGNVTIEDLWDLPLESRASISLDWLAKKLNKEVKENEEESFVVKKSSKNEISELKFEIVKYIIGVKLKEQEKRLMESKNREEKEKILEAIEKKDHEDLYSKSKEELLGRLKELDRLKEVD